MIPEFYRRSWHRTFRHVSRLSHYYKSRITPMGIFMGIAVVILALGGADTNMSRAYQTFSIGVAMLMFAWINGHFFRVRFSLKRRLPHCVTEGIPFIYTVEIKNHSTNTLKGLSYRDVVDTDLPSFDQFKHFRDPEDNARNPYDKLVGFPRWASLVNKLLPAKVSYETLPDIPAKGTISQRVTITPNRRGICRFTSGSLMRVDPLGLWRSLRHSLCQDHVTILPKRYPVPQLSLPGSQRLHSGGETFVQSIGESEEFHTLRDYRPGDPIKQIHWRSTARQNKPIVRENLDENLVRHALILDTFDDNTFSPTFEAAVSVAASFAADITRHETLMDLLFVTNTFYQVGVGRGRGQIQGLLEVLACIEPSPDDTAEILKDHVIQQNHLFCAAIIVLIDWGEHRKALIESLLAGGSTLHLFFIHEQEKDYLPHDITSHPHCHWHSIRAHRIEYDLNQ